MTTQDVLDHANHSEYRRGLILVIMAGVCWSTMGLLIRLMQEADVWQILFYRSCALAPFLFVLISFRSRGHPLRSIRRAGPSAVIGAMGLVLAFSGGIYAIQTTSVANAMFLFAAAPFIAAVLGWVILKETVSKVTWLAMAIATCGVAIMVLEGISLGAMQGNIAALASACGFAIFTIALRWGRNEDMLPVIFLAGCFAILTAGSVTILTEGSLDIVWHDIFIAFGMGIFQLGAGLTLYTLGSKTVPAAELALLSMTEVVFGPLWVWILLGETAGLYTLLGGGLLLLAISGNAIFNLRSS